MDQTSRPAEMQRIMPERVIAAGPDSRRELGSFGTECAAIPVSGEPVARARSSRKFVTSHMKIGPLW